MEHAISGIVGLFYLAQLWHIDRVLDHLAGSSFATAFLERQPEEGSCMPPSVEALLVEQVRHIADLVAGHTAGHTADFLAAVENIAGHLAAVEDTGQAVPKGKSVSI